MILIDKLFMIIDDYESLMIILMIISLMIILLMIIFIDSYIVDD